MERHSLLNFIQPNRLYDLYFVQKKSVAYIAALLGCSQGKINYWLEKYEIPKRTISDAVYALKNPSGDPFSFTEPKTLEKGILFGIGLGLYWGEGQKRGKSGLRLSNSDPKLIKKFIEFLEKFFAIDISRLKISIQIFEDISPKKALDYWVQELNLEKTQFYKPVVLKVRGNGTYKYKSEYGTAILYFNNVKLKQRICDLIENIH
jgi:hypothetical protein